ncbi:uncharacterized protein VP01_2146g4 [Puccinia sorghi]|uniref:DUF8040 domain-containing protein n=1 Tax=Puccinia sorghi TaxID=27349 RepID=A0A0L6V9Q8_9BASI|nr:uncharacterized protein VP01_2146g4 [Puccinia sorghi]
MRVFTRPSPPQTVIQLQWRFEHIGCCHPCHVAPPTSSPLTNPAINLQQLGSYRSNYMNTTLTGNPHQCKMESVLKLLSMEEQLAILLYNTGHNNSNRLAKDRFQNCAKTISNYVFHIFSVDSIFVPHFLAIV